jgi:lysophospholipase L1-like esterase
MSGLHDAGAYTNGTPDSMGALGDSITQAANVDIFHLGNNPQLSWSTGTDSSVQSLYLRILAGNPNINGKNFNYSVSGAKMTGLNGQAVNLNATPGGVEFVTIELGGNDVCTSNEASMTAVADYRMQFQTGMNTLTIGFPNRRIFVASVPDVYQLWALLHTNENARNAWSGFNICQSLLLNPLSMDPPDVQRRTNVRQRNIDFNTQLAEVCALYPQCTFDNNAIFNAQFTPVDVSSFDYFHPSIQGQVNLAAGAWAVYDMDDDGWATASEGTIGTDALDDCADNTADNAWPPDINNDGQITFGDIGFLTSIFGQALPPARRDIAPEPPDGVITFGDIGRITVLFGLGCS